MLEHLKTLGGTVVLVGLVLLLTFAFLSMEISPGKYQEIDRMKSEEPTIKTEVEKALQDNVINSIEYGRIKKAYRHALYLKRFI